MGRLSQLFAYVQAEQALSGQDLWSFSHLTITDGIKDLRKIIRGEMKAQGAVIDLSLPKQRELQLLINDKMNLIRPLAFFDNESTGANPVKDRIVSIAV